MRVGVNEGNETISGIQPKRKRFRREEREREVCSVMEKVNKFLTSICQTQLVVFFFPSKKGKRENPDLDYFIRRT